MVTGASRGIGKACALALAGAGAKVALAARQIDKLEEVAGEIRAAGGEALVVSMDLSSHDSIKEAFAQVVKDLGAVNILVNNAAVTRDGLALRMKPADWDMVMQTNLSGTFYCIQQVLSPMIQRTLRADCERIVRRGGIGQRGAGELRGVKSRRDRTDKGSGAGNGFAQRDGKRGSAGLYRNRYDRGAQG